MDILGVFYYVCINLYKMNYTTIKPLLIASLLLTFACSTKKVSEDDLIGHSYDAQFDMSQIKTKDPQELAFIQMAAAMKRSYTFEKEGKGSLKAGDVMNAPITWSIKGDSLMISMEMMEQKSNQAYAIESKGDGYTLKAKDQVIELKPL